MKDDMKNLLIVDDCLVKGAPAAKGDILENLDNGTAAILLSSGRAVLYKGEIAKKAAKKAGKKAGKKKAE